jgi:isochorismate hydrolase
MAKDYLKSLRAYTIRKACPDPNKAALLVVDMQRYFEPLAGPVLTNVLALIERCRARGMKIIFTRHGHRDPAEDGGMLATWWGDVIKYGTREWELMDPLKPAATESIVDKNRYSAFFKTHLDEDLRARGVEDLIISGVMTNCCCETTARDAFMHDYRVFFVADATATADEELHVASLKNLAYGFAYIVDTKRVCRHLSRAAI